MKEEDADLYVPTLKKKKKKFPSHIAKGKKKATLQTRTFGMFPFLSVLAQKKALPNCEWGFPPRGPLKDALTEDSNFLVTHFCTGDFLNRFCNQKNTKQKYLFKIV